jgi:iron complex transport system substrate-binding protein
MRYVYLAFILMIVVFSDLSQSMAAPDDSGRFVTDMAGRKVLIPHHVQRVITAGGTPAVNAFLFAMGKGETIMNGLPFSTRGKRWKYQTVFAPELVNLPVVSASSSSVWTYNLEVLAAIPNDIIFVDNELAANMLSKKGFTAIALNWKDPDCVEKTMTLMGEIFNRQDRVQEFEKYLQRNISIVSIATGSIPKEKRARVVYIRTKPLRLTMPSTASHLITLSNGIYAAPGAIPRNSVISIEQLMALNPDIILVGEPDEVTYISHENGYSQLNAVINRKVYAVPAGAHPWTAYTPEQSIAILWLSMILYPDRFKDINITDEVKYFYRCFFDYSLTDMQVNEILNQEMK